MLIQECQIKTATKIYHYQVNLNKQKLRKTEQHDIQSIQQSSFIRHPPKSVGAALSGPTTATLSAPLYNNFNVLCSVVFLFSMVSTVVICFLQNFSFNRGSFVFWGFNYEVIYSIFRFIDQLLLSSYYHTFLYLPTNFSSQFRDLRFLNSKRELPKITYIMHLSNYKLLAQRSNKHTHTPRERDTQTDIRKQCSTDGSCFPCE